MAEALEDRLCSDLVNLLGDLGLSGVSGVIPDIQSVYQHLLPEQVQLKLPCLLVTTKDQSPEEGDSDFEQDEVWYPVKILIVDQVQPNLEARRPTYRAWKRAIAARLRGLVTYPLLPNCPELIEITVRNGPDDAGGGRSQLFQSSVIARCDTRETRERGQG